MNNKLIKKADIIFIFIISMIIILGTFIFYKSLYQEPVNVVVEINGGEIYGKYPIDEYTEININDTNILKIDANGVYMLDANCPDKVCLGYAPIKSNVETIICLPNEVIVYLEGDTNAEIDVIS